MKDQEVFNVLKNTKLQFIINKLGNGEDVEMMIDEYESEYKCSFKFDQLRYDYSFLTALTLYEAVRLYDNLKESAKSMFIKIIEIDHKHLYELVNIHSTVVTFNTDVQSCLSS